MTDKILADLSPNWPTIFELASQIPQTSSGGRGTKNAMPVTQGLTPEPFPATPGYREVSAEQIASLRVPKITVESEIKGFQREKVNSHARKVARALAAGEEMPPIMVSIFPDGLAYVDDGQHRALGAIIARKPLEVVVKHRTVDQARKLFTNQGKAKSLRSDDTLLVGDSPLELYIQDALTSTNHPWSGLVSVSGGGHGRRMTPTTMGQLVGSYVYNSLSTGVMSFTRRPHDEFDEKLGHQLAELIQSFGNSTTNTMAFKGRMLRSIAFAAIHIFRRNPNVQDGDVERWKNHMPKFDFMKFPHLLAREQEMGVMMVEHWNKRLPEDRKVKPYHQGVAS